MMRLSWRCMIQVMATMLEEADSIPSQQMDTILEFLLTPSSEERPEAFECALQHRQGCNLAEDMLI